MKWIILLLIYSYAWAIKGEYASKEFENEASCKIYYELKSPEGKILKGTCSASLLSSKILMTADHCLGDINQNLSSASEDQIAPAKVICGEEEIEIKKTTRLREGGFDFQDIGLIELKKESHKKPFQIPENKTMYQELLQKNENCYLNGYGLDNDQKYGQLRAAKVTKLDSTPLNIYSSSTVFKVNGNVPDHGDSGGGVYCQVGEKNYLVGVIVGGILGSPSKDIEKIDSLFYWLQYIQKNNQINKELMSSVNHYFTLCRSIDQCVKLMKGPGELTLNVMKAIKKMNEFYTDKYLLSDYDQIQIMNSEMVDFWNEQNCFNRLYP